MEDRRPRGSPCHQLSDFHHNPTSVAYLPRCVRCQGVPGNALEGACGHVIGEACLDSLMHPDSTACACPGPRCKGRLDNPSNSGLYGSTKASYFVRKQIERAIESSSDADKVTELNHEVKELRGQLQEQSALVAALSANLEQVTRECLELRELLGEVQDGVARAEERAGQTEEKVRTQAEELENGTLKTMQQQIQDLMRHTAIGIDIWTDESRLPLGQRLRMLSGVDVQAQQIQATRQTSKSPTKSRDETPGNGTKHRTEEEKDKVLSPPYSLFQRASPPLLQVARSGGEDVLVLLYPDRILSTAKKSGSQFAVDYMAATDGSTIQARVPAWWLVQRNPPDLCSELQQHLDSGQEGVTSPTLSNGSLSASRSSTGLGLHLPNSNSFSSSLEVHGSTVSVDKSPAKQQSKSSLRSRVVESFAMLGKGNEGLSNMGRADREALELVQACIGETQMRRYRFFALVAVPDDTLEALMTAEGIHDATNTFLRHSIQLEVQTTHMPFHEAMPNFRPHLNRYLARLAKAKLRCMTLRLSWLAYFTPGSLPVAFARSTENSPVKKARSHKNTGFGDKVSSPPAPEKLVELGPPAGDGDRTEEVVSRGSKEEEEGQGREVEHGEGLEVNEQLEEREFDLSQSRSSGEPVLTVQQADKEDEEEQEEGMVYEQGPPMDMPEEDAGDAAGVSVTFEEGH